MLSFMNGSEVLQMVKVPHVFFSAIVVSKSGKSYKFRYTINLHKDDTPLLIYIKKKIKYRCGL